LKPWLGKILLALAGIIISLVVVEMGLRLLGVEYPIFFDYDPVLGNKLRPGVRGRYLTEGNGYVSINRDGLRDREHSLAHPADTLRIAILEDSYAEAMQVNQDETFWAVMAEELNRCANLRGRRVEVINFGQSGFGTTQELLTLQHRVWKYSPDVILLAFTTGNDLADNSRALSGIDYHPYHVFQGDKLILDDRQTKANWQLHEKSFFRRIIFRWKIDRLRIFQVLRQSKEVLVKWWQVHNFGRKANASEKGQEVGLSASVYREPTTDVWKEAWRVTEGLLLQMRDEVARKGARFFVVTLSSGIQVDPNPSNRSAFANYLGVSDLFYPERRLAGFCQARHIPILLLAPIFQEYAARHKVYLHGFGKSLGTGHWNQEGHRLAGRLIAEWLCPQLN